MIVSGEWFGRQALNALRHEMASRNAMETVAARSRSHVNSERPSPPGNAPRSQPKAKRRVLKNAADWTRIGRTIAKVPLASGYRFQLLQRQEIPTVIACVRAWFPEISVGGASCYLREDFFCDEVYFPGGLEKDVLVVLVKKGTELAGLFSCERDRHTLALYARLAVIAPHHRGMGLSDAFLALAERIGRSIRMEMIYGMATLKVPHVQRAFETRRWQLIGITPGYDQEMVAPGVVKRVYEAVYAKVLVADERLMRPYVRNLTEKTHAFFRLLFPRRRLKRA